MPIHSVSFRNFRNLSDAAIDLDLSGITVLEGSNGAGKTSVLEGIGYLVTGRSFRGWSRSAVVAHGRPRSILRGVLQDGPRMMSIEMEIKTSVSDGIVVNGKRTRGTDEIGEVVAVTVMTPEDADLVGGAPEKRRWFLEESLSAVRNDHDHLRRNVERILRQRSALLRQAGGQLDTITASTLDMWDVELARHGSEFAQRREQFCSDLLPSVVDAYRSLSSRETTVHLAYQRSWDGLLVDALRRCRTMDVRRAVTSAGPHRDDLVLSIEGLPARTHTSRGEQRSLAFALRLAVHEMVTTRRRTPPVILLDDVFSDLDRDRASRLVRRIAKGQAVVTTSTELPGDVVAGRRLRVDGGAVLVP